MQTSLIRCTFNFYLRYNSLCTIAKGFGIEQVLTQLAVKILFYDSTVLDEKRLTLILPEKQK